MFKPGDRVRVSADGPMRPWEGTGTVLSRITNEWAADEWMVEADSGGPVQRRWGSLRLLDPLEELAELAPAS